MLIPRNKLVMWERTVDGMELVAEASGDARTIQWEAGELSQNCHTFFLTAESHGIHSNPSNGYPVCPEVQLPDLVVRPGGSFTLNINVVSGE